MSWANRRYRTKMEVLRDVLSAAKRTSRKTRIIGLANLNQESFSRYARFAVAEGLLRRENGRYQTTTLADRWLTVAEGVFRKCSELSLAVDGLAQVTPGWQVDRLGRGIARPRSVRRSLRPEISSRQSRSTAVVTTQASALSAPWRSQGPPRRGGRARIPSRRTASNRRVR